MIDDGSTDGTGDIAAAAGAKVIALDGSDGSKARAMARGVEASDATAVHSSSTRLHRLTAAHLDAICEPFLEGRAQLSIGAFDYGRFWNPMVLRWPPLSGERIIPRWVWDAIPPYNLVGYTIEVRINEVIAERRLRTVVRTMPGVSHRNKRVKLGRRAGLRSTWAMYRELLRIVWHDRRRATQDVLVLPSRPLRRTVTRRRV